MPALYNNSGLDNMSGVSYIITVYNKAPFINYMLDGLASQTGDFKKQFIFINDGSTDNSMQLIREATQDWNNTLYIDQPNQGPAIATNNAAKKAIHPYLKMVDADDVLAPYATTLLLKAISKSNAAAAYSLPLGIDSSIDYSQDIQFPSEPDDIDVTVIDDILFYAIKTGWAGSSNLMVRRDAFHEVGGCDESVFVQDWSLPIRIARLYNICLFRELIVYFPKTATGRVMGNEPQMLHDLTATQYHFIKQHPDLDKRYQKMAAKRCIGRAWKWEQRINNASLFSKYFFLYAANRLGVPLNPLWLLKQTPEVFRKNNNIRIP
jgi:glycosyltransferase involved in cell wall biosynthesis